MKLLMQACSNKEMARRLLLSERTIQTHLSNIFVKRANQSIREIGERTFNRFMDGARLLSIEDSAAIIGTPQAYARDWIENRLSDKLKHLLCAAAVRCVVLGDNVA